MGFLISCNLIVAMRRWWSPPTSAALFTLIDVVKRVLPAPADQEMVFLILSGAKVPGRTSPHPTKGAKPFGSSPCVLYLPA